MVDQQFLGAGLEILMSRETTFLQEKLLAIGHIAAVGTHGGMTCEHMVEIGNIVPQTEEIHFVGEPRFAMVVIVRQSEHHVRLLQPTALNAAPWLSNRLADAREPLCGGRLAVGVGQHHPIVCG